MLQFVVSGLFATNYTSRTFTDYYVFVFLFNVYQRVCVLSLALGTWS